MLGSGRWCAIVANDEKLLAEIATAFFGTCSYGGCNRRSFSAPYCASGKTACDVHGIDVGWRTRLGSSIRTGEVAQKATICRERATNGCSAFLFNTGADGKSRTHRG